MMTYLSRLLTEILDELKIGGENMAVAFCFYLFCDATACCRSKLEQATEGVVVRVFAVVARVHMTVMLARIALLVLCSLRLLGLWYSSIVCGFVSWGLIGGVSTKSFRCVVCSKERANFCGPTDLYLLIICRAVCFRNLCVVQFFISG